MPPALRLCLVLEHTAKAGAHWQQGATLRHLIEPLLAVAESVPGGCEVALVVYGAPFPHSAAPLESSLGWWSGAAQFRQALLDSLEFAGGGNQPVVLAEALVEAAALFACAPGGSGGGGSACQQHCLVCLASDPDTQPVPWPITEDACLAKLPGLATSAELCHTLRRRGVLVSLAGPNLLSSSHQLWHLTNLVSDTPVSLENARWDRIKRLPGGDLMQQQLMRCVVALPAGGGHAALPFWPQAVDALQSQAGAKLLGAGSRSAASVPGPESLERTANDGEEPAAKRARAGAGTWPAGAAAAPAAAAALQAVPPGHAASAPAAAGVSAALGVVVPSPEGPPVVQWTPPGTAGPAQATPPVTASPGSFWEVLNAEILSPAEAESVPAQTPAVHTPGGYAAGAPEPAVPGLPMPPVQQQPAPPAPAAQQQALRHAAPQQQQQQQQQQQPGMGAAPPMAASMVGMPGGGATHGPARPSQAPAAPAGASLAMSSSGPGMSGKYALVHTAQVVLDPKVTQGGAMLLGVGQVLCLNEAAAALRAIQWPPELHVVKTLAIDAAKSVLASRPGSRHTRLRMSYATPEAEGFAARLLDAGAVGVVQLYNGAFGILHPTRHPQTQQLVLQLVVVPSGKA